MRRPCRIAAGWTMILSVTVVVGPAGCGRQDGPSRYPVSGTVRYAGKPAAAGVVVFEPDAEAGNTGPQGRAEIRDGRFSTSPGQGSVAGAVIARVFVSDGKPHPENPRGSAIGPAVEIRLTLPAKASTIDLDADLRTKDSPANGTSATITELMSSS